MKIQVEIHLKIRLEIHSKIRLEIHLKIRLEFYFKVRLEIRWNFSWNLAWNFAWNWSGISTTGSCQRGWRLLGSWGPNYPPSPPALLWSPLYTSPCLYIYMHIHIYAVIYLYIMYIYLDLPLGCIMLNRRLSFLLNQSESKRIYHFPSDFAHQTAFRLVFQINRKMVNTLD